MKSDELQGVLTKTRVSPLN